jgi:hypothetical protein
VGLAPYFYLPLRSAADPALDWGDPETLRRLWEHVTGAQFRHLLVTPFGNGPQLRYLASLPLRELGWPGLVVAAAGGIWLARRCRAVARMGLRWRWARRCTRLTTGSDAARPFEGLRRAAGRPAAL